MNDTHSQATLRPLPKGRAASDTRTALLAAGRTLFARWGFDGASVRRITEEAGANLGAITYHFGSKRDLYEAVLEEELGPIVDRIGRIATSDGTGMERLESVVEALFDHLGRHPELPRLLLQELSAGKPPPAPAAAMIGRNLGHVRAILADGIRDGSVRNGDPTLLALSVVSQPIYMTLVAPLLREVTGLDLADQTNRDQAVRHVQGIVTRGLAGKRRTTEEAR